MASVRVERRLSAILAADIVGYSRLIEADEAGTLAAIRSVRLQVVDPLLAEHRGRVVKLMGDGTIVEFASVVDAVACAVALQKGIRVNQAYVSPDRRIAYRIGVNLGDVVVEGDDLFGDGINIAARLEALAESGGICISDTVQRQLEGKTDFPFADAGEQSLKNIARPVRVWRWATEPIADAPGKPLSLPDRPSIAVLPFDNLSGQPEETYFSDGITEDIITGLARFRSLFVIARNSSFAFRGKPIDLAEIGRKLGVSFILEGSVRRAGQRVRITAQLIEVASGAHLWAERYDRGLDDIFAVQDEVAQMIVAALFGRIQEAGVQRSARMPTANLTAHDCMLRGLSYFRGYADDDNPQARDMFERAVALDPKYAVALAYLALAQVTVEGSASAPREILESAFASASKAIELDPQDGRCHRILSTLYLYRRDHEMAEHHSRRAIDLNPNDADGMMQMGRLLAFRGRPEEAVGWLEAGMRLNPLYPPWYSANLGIALYSLRRYDDAAKTLRRIPRPGAWMHARLAACYSQLGQMAAARMKADEVLRERPDFSTAEFLRSSVLLERAEDREHLREGLIKAGLPQ